MVALYHATSFQGYKMINHGESVRILRFKSKTGLMASCGIKVIRIWDTYTGETTHKFHAHQRFMDLAFNQNFLIAAPSKTYISLWDLDNAGAQQPNRPWSDSGEFLDTRLHRTPCAISIAVSHRMMTVTHSG